MFAHQATKTFIEPYGTVQYSTYLTNEAVDDELDVRVEVLSLRLGCRAHHLDALLHNMVAVLILHALHHLLKPASPRRSNKRRMLYYSKEGFRLVSTLLGHTEKHETSRRPSSSSFSSTWATLAQKNCNYLYPTRFFLASQPFLRAVDNRPQ